MPSILRRNQIWMFALLAWLGAFRATSAQVSPLSPPSQARIAPQKTGGPPAVQDLAPPRVHELMPPGSSRPHSPIGQPRNAAIPPAIIPPSLGEARLSVTPMGLGGVQANGLERNGIEGNGFEGYRVERNGIDAVATGDAVAMGDAVVTDADDANVYWWMQMAGEPLRQSTSAMAADVPGLMTLAAQFSARVLAVQQEPWIRGSQMVQAQAAFAPRLYSDTRIDSLSDPVGNTLTTGGPPRLNQNIWAMNSGLRGQSSTGATYSLGQKLGFTNSNSRFFFPNDQGSSRLAATISQPLLRNRAIDLNRSLVLTTSFDTEAARNEYFDAVQQQLLAVAKAYWSLYTERATLVQRRQHLERARRIMAIIEERKDYDTSHVQYLRARSAVTLREAELARADANIRNSESRLRSLINAPGISDQPELEILSCQPPLLESIVLDLEQEVGIALVQRPEILKLMSKINAANIRYRYASNQTRPKLDLIMEGYVAGLQGDSAVLGAVGNQFSAGRPGVAGGLEYELPYRNRAAHAQVNQSRFELVQLENLLRESRANIRTEVESALRNTEAAYRAALGRQDSLISVMAEYEYLEDRWQSLRGDPKLGQLQLADLLESQVRLFQEEQSLLAAMVEHNLSMIEAQRATGALVRFSN